MAVASNTAIGTVLLAGDLAGSSNANSPQLTPTGVTPGVYKGASVVVDAKGRIVYARSLSNYDVPCATSDSCGIVAVSGKHFIDIASKKISIKKASKTEFGVVKVGAGFGKDCCEIFVNYVEATPTTLGVVTVPTSGGLLIDGAGQISLPLATTTTQGSVKAVDGNGLTLTAGTLSYAPPDASASVKGFVTVGDGFTVAAGQLSIANASSSAKGLFRFNSDFTYTSNTYSYTTIAGAGLGLVKVGSGLVMDEDGTLNRGTGVASSIAKGTVQVTAGNGLAISGGVISWAPVNATASVKGVVQVGSDLTVAGGFMSMVQANGTATRGYMTAHPTSGNLTVTNGLIDIGPNVVLKDATNVYTKAQVTSLSTIGWSSSVTPDFSMSNSFTITLGGTTTLNTPTNMVNGGRYVIIVKQDATGGRTLSFGADWKFAVYGGNSSIAKSIALGPNAISVINITISDSKLHAQIEYGFA